MKVKNVSGTASKSCACGSWIDHWVKFSKQSKPIYCSVVGCWHTDPIGAHVRKSNSMLDQTVYIAPICQECNMSTNELLIPDTTILVPAAASSQCGKG